MTGKHLFYELGINIMTSTNNHIFRSTKYPHTTILIHSSEITSIRQPLTMGNAAYKKILIESGVNISWGNTRAINRQHTPFTRGTLPNKVILFIHLDSCYRMVRQKLAYRTHFRLFPVWSIGCYDTMYLRHPPHLAHPNTKPAMKGAH